MVPPAGCSFYLRELFPRSESNCPIRGSPSHPRHFASRLNPRLTTGPFYSAFDLLLYPTEYRESMIPPRPRLASGKLRRRLIEVPPPGDDTNSRRSFHVDFIKDGGVSRGRRRRKTMPTVFFSGFLSSLARLLRASRCYFREYNKESRRRYDVNQGREEAWRMAVGHSAGL